MNDQRQPVQPIQPKQVAPALAFIMRYLQPAIREQQRKAA
jgi:hypothetical protein